MRANASRRNDYNDDENEDDDEVAGRGADRDGRRRGLSLVSRFAALVCARQMGQRRRLCRGLSSASLNLGGSGEAAMARTNLALASIIERRARVETHENRVMSGCLEEKTRPKRASFKRPAA